MSQIDEVGAVREDMSSRVVAVLLGLVVELVLRVRGEWWAGPFALGLEEQGEGIGADVDRVLDGVLDALRVCH